MQIFEGIKPTIQDTAFYEREKKKRKKEDAKMLVHSRALSYAHAHTYHGALDKETERAVVILGHRIDRACA